MKKKVVVQVLTVAALVILASPTFAAGWGPAAALQGWVLNLVQNIAGCIFGVVCLAIGFQNEQLHHMFGKLTPTIMAVALAVGGVPFLASLGVNFAAGAAMVNVGR
jgi:hypothetical protein